MKFPKKIYVVHEEDTDGSKYLVANEDASAFSEVGVAVSAAEYTLSRPGVIISTEVKVK